MIVHLSTKEKGDRAEDIAVQFLQSKDYTILEQNWRSSTLEVDIICSKGNFIIFVEVKYRKDDKYGDPVEFISDQKMQHLSILAGRYMEEVGYNGQIRFDVIGMRPDGNGKYKIRHLKDVQFSGWDP